MDEPNYENYTKEELADVLNHIDRAKYPERTARVESIFKSRGGTEEDQEIAKEKPYRAWTGILCLLYAPYVLIFGVYTERFFYTVHIESL